MKKTLKYKQKKKAKGYFNKPEITVFCAVWNKQKNKNELLRSHYENLLKQNLDLEILYIFDEADHSPEWLDASVCCFEDPLTIYEAWAAAVALCETRYVLNLNLDDRLAIDALEHLLRFIKLTNSALIGGEWEICFTDTHLSQSFKVSEINETKFYKEWPPKHNVNIRQRLGSGTNERGTFGPSTLWDLEKIGKWYPSNFDNGEKINSIGDTIFWSLLGMLKLKRHRIPMIIGKYLSDPNNQAEFRTSNEMDKLKYTGVTYPLKYNVKDHIIDIS